MLRSGDGAGTASKISLGQDRRTPSPGEGQSVGVAGQGLGGRRPRARV